MIAQKLPANKQKSHNASPKTLSTRKNYASDPLYKLIIGREP